MGISNTQSFIKNVIIPEFPSLIQKGRLIYCKDTSELLRGIYFDSSSYNKDTFTVQAFIQPLYLKREHLIFTFGERIRDEVSHEWFSMETENISTKTIELVNKALEYINQARNASEFYNRLLIDIPTLRMLEMLAYTSCYITHSYALRDLDHLIDELHKTDLNIEWRKELLVEIEEFKAIYSQSPEKANFILKNNIKETLANLKLK